MNRINELQLELSKANARIAELEKINIQRPVTMRRLKTEIAEAIGAQFSGGSSYCTTVSRDDLVKIHAWILQRIK